MSQASDVWRILQNHVFCLTVVSFIGTWLLIYTYFGFPTAPAHRKNFNLSQSMKALDHCWVKAHVFLDHNNWDNQPLRFRNPLERSSPLALSKYLNGFVHTESERQTLECMFADPNVTVEVCRSRLIPQSLSDLPLYGDEVGLYQCPHISFEKIVSVGYCSLTKDSREILTSLLTRLRSRPLYFVGDSTSRQLFSALQNDFLRWPQLFHTTKTAELYYNTSNAVPMIGGIILL